MWAIYPDGSATRYEDKDSASWILNGVDFELSNVKDDPSLVYRGVLRSNCVQMTGVLVANQDPFMAEKLLLPLP